MPLTHARVVELAARSDAGYVLVAGRYEGIDERLVAREVDEEIAIGDFVVSGGELPALMLIDAIARLLPGALNDEQSAREDSFADGLLDCPHYTRPEVYEGDGGARRAVVGASRADSPLAPRAGVAAHDVERRPDLLAGRALSKEEAELLAEASRQAEAAGSKPTDRAHQGILRCAQARQG